MLYGFYHEHNRALIKMETEHTWQTADGARLRYRLIKRGGDTAVVMLHGVASNLTRWSELVQHIQISQQWDLLRIDLRGHGRSYYRGKINHEIWVNDLVALLQQRGYQHAIVIGHSLGAQLALHFAHLYPHMSKGLVLIDPLFPQALQGRLAWLAKLRPLLWLIIRVVQLLNCLGVKRRCFPELDLQVLDQQTRVRMRDNPDMDIADYYARPFSDIKNLPLANYLQDLYAVIQPLPVLTSIKTSALVMLSQGVGLSDIAATQRQLEQLSHVETVIIDANHWMLTEKPEQTRFAIEQWCNRLV